MKKNLKKHETSSKIFPISEEFKKNLLLFAVAILEHKECYCFSKSCENQQLSKIFQEQILIKRKLHRLME
jgi:hypothetical protein